MSGLATRSIPPLILVANDGVKFCWNCYHMLCDDIPDFYNPCGDWAYCECMCYIINEER